MNISDDATAMSILQVALLAKNNQQAEFIITDKTIQTMSRKTIEKLQNVLDQAVREGIFFSHRYDAQRGALVIGLRKFTVAEMLEKGRL